MNFLLGRKTAGKHNVDSHDLSDHTDDMRCQKICDGVTKALVSLANEPSLALFRIQEHVHKTAPGLLNDREKALHLQSSLQGSCFDLDYAISAVNSTTKAVLHMNRLNELLKSSLFTKLQLDYADKHSSDFEMGIDLVADVALHPPISHPSSVVSPALRTSESIERTTSPRLQTLASSMSAAAVEVRQKAVTLTQRALFTRSADVSSMAQSPPFTRISASINFPAVPAVPDPAALEHLVETGVEVDEANQ